MKPGTSQRRTNWAGWFIPTALLWMLLSPFVELPVFAQSEGSRVNQVAEMDFRKAPVDFKNRLLATEKEMKEKGGFVVAGKVEIDKAPPPKPGEYAVALRFDKSNAEDTYKHPGGWFISQVIPKDKIYKTTFVVATFRELPSEAVLTLDEGKINWVIATLEKTMPREQAIISGTVIDELGKLVGKAKVTLNLSRSNGNFGNSSTGLLLTKTDAQGKYAFDGVTFQDYTLSVTHDQLSSDTAILTVPETPSDSSTAPKTGDDSSKSQSLRPLKLTRIFAKQGRQELASDNGTMILGQLRAITIDYEYSLGNYFTGDVVKKGIVWRDNLYDSSPITFSTGSLAGGKQLDDLWLINMEGDLFFRHFYHSGEHKNGHYDLGDVPFDSVDKIDEARAYESAFRSGARYTPCVLNHVYGVKTYNGKYAKFVVRKIELLSDLEKAGASKRKRP